MRNTSKSFASFFWVRPGEWLSISMSRVQTVTLDATRGAKLSFSQGRLGFEVE